jgi:hypothetical protein
MSQYVSKSLLGEDDVVYTTVYNVRYGMGELIDIALAWERLNKVKCFKIFENCYVRDPETGKRFRKLSLNMN